MKFAYHSDIGLKRQINQDRCCVLSNQANQLFGIVCDGMGGHQAGEQAAQMTMDILCQSFLAHDIFYSEAAATQWLTDIIETANREVYEDALSNPLHAGMGTTLVAVLCMQNSLIVCHAGDSRAYFFDGLSLQQLTSDHTYVNLLVENGSISKEQAKSHPQKNVLMKAVGVFPELVITQQVYHDFLGMIFLCSDGLYNLVSDETIQNILMQDLLMEEKVMTLIKLANQNGGFDNISVVLIDNRGGENDE